MGPLDFKFLILLGLSIVIYFIYKELELHRSRLTFCEEKIKEFKHPPINLIQNTEFITKNKPLNNENENKNLSILLPIKTLSQSIKNKTETSSEEFSSSKSSTFSEKNNSELNIDSKFKIESETKHLEIYSNDNDNNLETTISDSLMVYKKTNNLISLKNELEGSIVLQKILNNSEKSDTEKNILEQKILNNTEKSDTEKNILEQKILNNSEKSNLKNNSEKNDSNILSKMKFLELQNIAKKHNLNLHKKVNGQQKKKTKEDLIDELSKIFNK